MSVGWSRGVSPSTEPPVNSTQEEIFAHTPTSHGRLQKEEEWISGNIAKISEISDQELHNLPGDVKIAEITAQGLHNTRETERSAGEMDYDEFLIGGGGDLELDLELEAIDDDPITPPPRPRSVLVDFFQCVGLRHNRNEEVPVPVVEVMEDNNEEFQWPEDVPHPLLIPDIVRDIFERLDMKDVENVRNVSRGWNSEACNVIQKKKIIALLEVDAVKYYLDKMGATTSFPHSNFELHMDNLLETATMLKFWETFGSHMKFVDFRQSSLLVEILFDIMDRFLTNMEKLSLRCLPKKVTMLRRPGPMPWPGGVEMEDWEENVEENQRRPGAIFENWMGNAGENSRQRSKRQALPTVREDWAELRFLNVKELSVAWGPVNETVALDLIKILFKAMPNLERLTIPDIPNNPSTGAQPIPSAVVRLSLVFLRAILDPEVNLPHLRALDFELEVGNDELIGLKAKGFQFENLKLKLNKSTKNSNLKDLLVSISSSITNLEIAFPNGFFSSGVTFPSYYLMKPCIAAVHLRRLKELTLKNYYGSLESLKQLNQLKKLVVNTARLDTCSVSSLKFYESSISDHHLLSLQTDVCTNSGALFSISSCFPFLRVIKVVGVDDQGLGVIYRNLPYLTELQITQGKVSDRGLSGVPLEVCKDMQETGTYHFVEPAKFRYDLFLGSLQYLEVISLEGEDISDMSIFFALVDCKNLRSLTLHSPAVTDIGIMKIADSMFKKLQHLDVHQCEGITESSRYYVREKMKNVKTVIVDPFEVIPKTRYSNPYRQVGHPYRGKCRQERYPGDDEYGIHGVDGAANNRGMAMYQMQDDIAMRRRRALAMRIFNRGPQFHMVLRGAGGAIERVNNDDAMNRHANAAAGGGDLNPNDPDFDDVQMFIDEMDEMEQFRRQRGGPELVDLVDSSDDEDDMFEFVVRRGGREREGHPDGPIGAGAFGAPFVANEVEVENGEEPLQRDVVDVEDGGFDQDGGFAMAFNNMGEDVNFDLGNDDDGVA